jgi:hypothetical protein
MTSTTEDDVSAIRQMTAAQINKLSNLVSSDSVVAMMTILVQR